MTEVSLPAAAAARKRLTRMSGPAVLVPNSD